MKRKTFLASLFSGMAAMLAAAFGCLSSLVKADGIVYPKHFKRGGVKYNFAIPLRELTSMPIVHKVEGGEIVRQEAVHAIYKLGTYGERVLIGIEEYPDLTF